MICDKCDGKGKLRHNRTIDGKYVFGSIGCDKCNGTGEASLFAAGQAIAQRLCSVISSAPGKYPLWEIADKLVCPHLRLDIERYIGNGKYQTNWIAKECDPCPKCKRTNCHNHGKPFHDMERLTVEKAHCL